jgi:hypothetical protein
VIAHVPPCSAACIAKRLHHADLVRCRFIDHRRRLGCAVAWIGTKGTRCAYALELNDGRLRVRRVPPLDCPVAGIRNGAGAPMA